MMSSASVPSARITVKRVVRWTVILFPIVFLCLSIWYFIERQIPQWYYWEAELVCLISAEVAYSAIVTAAVIGVVVAGFFLVRGERFERSRSTLARSLLLCVSLLLAATAAEVVCGLWQERQHSRTAMPIGGLGRELGQADELRFRAPIADMPLRTDFPDPPGDREIDVVILGESSRRGSSLQQLDLARALLDWKLLKAIPGRPIRTRVFARSGSTLEWQHRDLPKLLNRPDILIVYCGHNEFSARLADSREHTYYFDQRLPSTGDMLVDRVERSSSVCALIRETADKCRIAIPPATSGRRKLVDVPLYSSTEYNTLLVDFRRRLEAIVCYAEQVGAIPILILPAANDAGFEPSRSFLPAATTRRRARIVRG